MALIAIDKGIVRYGENRTPIGSYLPTGAKGRD